MVTIFVSYPALPPSVVYEPQVFQPSNVNFPNFTRRHPRGVAVSFWHWWSLGENTRPVPKGPASHGCIAVKFLLSACSCAAQPNHPLRLSIRRHLRTQPPLRLDRVWWKRSLGTTGVGLRWRHVRGQCHGTRSSSGKTAQRRNLQSRPEGTHHCHGGVGWIRFLVGHSFASQPLSVRGFSRKPDFKKALNGSAERALQLVVFGAGIGGRD
jgi:hypothetical protein